MGSKIFAQIRLRVAIYDDLLKLAGLLNKNKEFVKRRHYYLKMQSCKQNKFKRK